MGIIYMITCTETKKVYIGQTTKSLEERMRVHYQCSRRLAKSKLDPTRRVPLDIQHSLLYNAMNEYGEAAFIPEILLTVDEYMEDLDGHEQRFIKLYNSNVDGYNLTSGGRYFSHSDETIKTMKKAKCANINKQRNSIIHDMPPYVKYRPNKGKQSEMVGFNNHPLCGNKSFAVSKYGSIEGAKQALLDYLAMKEKSSAAAIDIPKKVIKK